MGLEAEGSGYDQIYEQGGDDAIKALAKKTEATSRSTAQTQNPSQKRETLEEYRARWQKEVAANKQKRDGDPIEGGYSFSKEELAKRTHGERVTKGEEIVPYEPGQDKMVRYEEGEEAIVPYRHDENDDIVPVESNTVPPVPVPPEQVPTPIPAPESEKVIIADVSEVAKSMAWRIAENRLNEIINYNSGRERGGFLSRLWGGIKAPFTREFWKSKFATAGESGYLNKFYREALQEITSNQSLMRDIQGRLTGGVGSSTGVERAGAGLAEHYQVLDAVVHEVEEEAIQDMERGQDVVGRGDLFAGLFARHMNGEFADRAAFEAAAKEVIDQAVANGDLTKDQFGRAEDADGLMFATNLWEIAERYKTSATAAVGREIGADLTPEEKTKLESLLGGIANLDIRLATKLQDVNEMRAKRPDKMNFWDKLENFTRMHPALGSVLNPTTLGLLAGYGTRTALRNTALIGGAAVAGGALFATMGVPLIVGAGVAGGIAFANRMRHLKYDRGMEQRREALGLEGEGKRAERLRRYGFSGLAMEASELAEAIEAGNDDALLEAAARLKAEEILRDNGRPGDLVWVGEEEGTTYGTNVISKSALRVAVRQGNDRMRAADPDWEARVQNRAEGLVADVQSQDKRFGRYRFGESAKAGAFSAITAGVLGAVAQEIHDTVMEHTDPAAAARNITLVEYLRGERPRIEHWQIGDDNIGVNEVVTGPDGSRGINVPLRDLEGPDGSSAFMHYNIDQQGNIAFDLQHSRLPEGVTLSDDGKEIIFTSVKGVEGGSIATSWDQLRKYATTRHHELFDSSHSSWTKFYENQRMPFGNSYHEGYVANAEGTELQMSFQHGGDGYHIDVSRMAGHTAFGSGGEFPIKSDTPMLVTIGPRDFASSHEVITMEISPGKDAVLPEDIGKIIFDNQNGNVQLRPGFMVTACERIAEHDGKVVLGHVAADFRTGDSNIPTIPDIVEHRPIPDASHFPPKVAEGPIPIPIDFRRPIGNVVPPEKEESRERHGEEMPPQPTDRSVASEEPIAPEQHRSNDTPPPESSGERVTNARNQVEQRDQVLIEAENRRVIADEMHAILRVSNFEDRRRATVALRDSGRVPQDVPFKWARINDQDVLFEEVQQENFNQLDDAIKYAINILKQNSPERRQDQLETEEGNGDENGGEIEESAQVAPSVEEARAEQTSEDLDNPETRGEGYMSVLNMSVSSVASGKFGMDILLGGEAKKLKRFSDRKIIDIFDDESLTLDELRAIYNYGVEYSLNIHSETNRDLRAQRLSGSMAVRDMAISVGIVGFDVNLSGLDARQTIDLFQAQLDKPGYPEKIAVNMRQAIKILESKQPAIINGPEPAVIEQAPPQVVRQQTNVIEGPQAQKIEV